MYEEIKQDMKNALKELLEKSELCSGDVLVIGCSSSEITGEIIGKGSAPKAAEAVMEAVLPVLKEKGIFLAAQCCEHLNRALVIERRAAEAGGLEIVSAVPKVKAGGAFATAAFTAFESPVLVESVKAGAGLDIGNTLIGMHLRNVAVPVRLSVKKIGEAPLVAARTRPKYIGGSRACYE